MSWRAGSGISGRYSVPTFWLDSNTQAKNPDPNRVLAGREPGPTSMTRPDAASLVYIRRKINQNNKSFNLSFNYVIKHSMKFVDVNCIQKINSFKNKNLKRQHCWAAVDYNFKSNIHFYNVLENINEKVTLKIYLKHYFNCASLSDLSSIKHMWQV